jgi:hypothetical protein
MLDFCHLHQHQRHTLELRTRERIGLPSLSGNLLGQLTSSPDHRGLHTWGSVLL